ncbi:hypothetical protein [Microbacterium sp. No. 7]|uniref:hypothetical protein n=1 Tax=Microbacterium sp. No. 7 TaxID=1714373 RepID=UPI0006D08810|nr:hypothetical protein [Microbacterium sp. No. 7]
MPDAPIPLPVHPWPLSAERLAILKAAKALIDTPIRVIPVEAAYGTPGRVLCLGDWPPFLCDFAPVRPENVDSIESVAAALRFVLGGGEARWGDEQLLSKWMGVAVGYSHSEAWA